jgi:hypothetical protein
MARAGLKVQAIKEPASLGLVKRGLLEESRLLSDVDTPYILRFMSRRDYSTANDADAERPLAGGRVGSRAIATHSPPAVERFIESPDLLEPAATGGS